MMTKEMTTQIEINVRKMDIAEAAKVLRKELKQTFPETKFNVRIERYSLGESIDVFWAKGPEKSEVDKILSRYQDVAYDNFGDVLGGGNRYAQSNRSYHN